MWAELTGNIILVSEYKVLREMDRAYCDSINKEITLYQERLEAKQKQRR